MWCNAGRSREDYVFHGSRFHNFTCRNGLLSCTRCPCPNSGIAPDSTSAQTFVQNVVKQTVFDVLEHEGRSALLPDSVISAILSQLTLSVTYTPMLCQKAPGLMDTMNQMKESCIIVVGTVTGICTGDMAMRWTLSVRITQFLHTFLSAEEKSLQTTNVIMANWSRMMWQNVVDRAVRMLASGTFGSHFFLTRATVGGN
ncbi:hypothetical protein KIN20_031940 [Parelaphostrongylus tenuis]|uniref:Uncharacterized protein n=1 Tax=Parelaphostrongylus tenuis TaxID=148309 RepID=A0AAD5WHM9_PARTN|nr:hypothetical protein KIN20_031940 [Parelaphostrongylus tenuis]